MGRGRPPKRKAVESGPSAYDLSKAVDGPSAKKKRVEATAATSRSRRSSTNDGSPLKGGRHLQTSALSRPLPRKTRSSEPAVRKSLANEKESLDAAEAKEANADVKVNVSSPKDENRTAQRKPGRPSRKKSKSVDAEDEADEASCWLMKAEPESRIEKGKDVKFSIDDLEAASVPEPWDGVRNPIARNNMRTMMKGDQAFFYHSNCKVPGIVGVMEIVQEHSVDESAFDPDHPYYDAKSTRDKPKWCVVHVEFRQKFPKIITLRDLRSFSKDGGELENMQTLKMSRLSVSKVTKKEWDFILSLVDMEAVAQASASNQPKMIPNAVEANGNIEGEPEIEKSWVSDTASAN